MSTVRSSVETTGCRASALAALGALAMILPLLGALISLTPRPVMTLPATFVRIAGPSTVRGAMRESSGVIRWTQRSDVRRATRLRKPAAAVMRV